jgi:hypothetical protein
LINDKREVPDLRASADELLNCDIVMAGDVTSGIILGRPGLRRQELVWAARATERELFVKKIAMSIVVYEHLTCPGFDMPNSDRRQFLSGLIAAVLDPNGPFDQQALSSKRNTLIADDIDLAHGCLFARNKDAPEQFIRSTHLSTSGLSQSAKSIASTS